MKKSFILHIDSLDILDELTDEQAGQLFKAIKNHHKEQENNLDPLIKMAFIPFKNQFIRDDDKYEQFIEKQSENGAKGGRPKGSKKPKKPKPLNKNPKNPSEPKKAYNDNDSDSINDNKSDNGNEKENNNETYFSASAEAAPRKVSEKLYPRMVEAYDLFCKEFTGAGSKMDGGEGKAMKEIIAYLDKNVTDKNGNRDEEVMAAWTYIFQHWRDLDAFTQKSITLKKINSNIQSILAQLKNGKLTGKTETKAEAALAANERTRQELLSRRVDKNS